MTDAYAAATSIRDFDFSGRSVLVAGGRFMGREYVKALQAMGVRQVVVATRSEETARACREALGCEARGGGVEAVLRGGGTFDLCIVATGIPDLLPLARQLAEAGQPNVLVEKPGALTAAALEAFPGPARVRIAYNRNCYPNLLLAERLAREEGGITSARYTFTEWVHTIDFTNNPAEVYARWGISNSLHVIAMAHRLIGLPATLAAVQAGGFPWHPSGSRFAGSGRTAGGAVFSYAADWESAGRWSLEIHTRERAYRFIPLESLAVSKRGTVAWNDVAFEVAHPGVKPGVAEELAAMLEPSLEAALPLVTPAQAAALTRVAEEIFGYSGVLPSTPAAQAETCENSNI